MTAQACAPELLSFYSTAECPFFDGGSSCRAALLTYRPEARQVFFYCSSDDHDSCALFLARALRSSAAGGLDREMAAYCGK